MRRTRPINIPEHLQRGHAATAAVWQPQPYTRRGKGTCGPCRGTGDANGGIGFCHACNGSGDAAAAIQFPPLTKAAA